MSGIRTVAIAGASGKLGTFVLKALLDANFDLTVLTRAKKADAYAANVKVIEVDFTSLESLTAALHGIDAVVSTVASTAIESQTVLIDAAVTAGVKRFIPSEYGNVTTNPKVKDFPIYASMWKIRSYLQEIAEIGKLTWTVLACGAFLEYVFHGPQLLDFANHRVILFDEGDNEFSSSSFSMIGKAIAGILKHSGVTRNRIVRSSEVILMQKKLLGFAEELRPDIKWEVSKVPACVVLKQGLDGFSAGDYSMGNVMKIITGTAGAGETYGAAYHENDNELLGIEGLMDIDLKKFIAQALL